MGYIEVPEWGVELRKGQHKGLISFKTWRRVQDRLYGINRLPTRKNLSEDFPLRGYVVCDDCGNALTACWSTGNTKRHPYYLCPERGCESYGKSIRRELIEGEFEKLLASLQLTSALFAVASRMFKDIWDHQIGNVKEQAAMLSVQLKKIERQIEQLMERIIEAELPSVAKAYEAKIGRLEQDKLATHEKMAGAGRPKSGFDETLRTALGFLASPCNLWNTERLEDRQTVLQLAFASKLRYRRKDGFTTADMAFPFKALASVSSGSKEMARPKG